MIAKGVEYHDSFKPVNSGKKTPNPCGPKAATGNVDALGQEWCLSFDWLSTYDSKVLNIGGLGRLQAEVFVPSARVLTSHGMSMPIVLC